MKVEYELKLGQVRQMIDQGGKTVEVAVSRAIPKALAILERHHKREEFRRGASAGPSVAGRVSSRTGELSKSYRIYHERGSLVGYYGSELTRAAILERGGEIKAGAKLLSIPTQAAKVGVGGAMSPRRYPGLRFMWPIYKKTGKKALGMVEGGKSVVYFWLVDKVTIPPRLMLERTQQAREGDVAEFIADAAEKGLLGNA